jgi:hypothetical protein
MFPVFATLILATNAVHVWHQVTSNESAWCQVSQALEYDYWFTNATGANISNFAINETPYIFGMTFGPTADFNMMYTVTCAPEGAVGLSAPKSLFAIHADGPARPVVSTLNYNGATSRAEIATLVIRLFVYLVNEV